MGGFGGGGGGGTNDSNAGAGGMFGGAGGVGINTGSGLEGGGGGGGAGLGGALFLRAGTLTLVDVQLTGNSATGGQPGGAMDTTQRGVAGQGKGGALFLADGTTATGSGVTYANNTASDALDVATDNPNLYGTLSAR